MGGFAMAFAGALKGLGSGMASKGQADLEQRYKVALENLRQQNQSTNNAQVADLNDRNAARDDERDLNKSLTVQHDTQAYNTRTAQAGATAAAAEAERGRQHDERMLRIRAQLEQDGSAAAARLKGQIEAGQVQEVHSDGETGETFVIFKDGSSKKAEGVILRPKPTAKSDGTGSLLDYGKKNSVADFVWDPKTGKFTSNKED